MGASLLFACPMTLALDDPFLMTRSVPFVRHYTHYAAVRHLTMQNILSQQLWLHGIAWSARGDRFDFDE